MTESITIAESEACAIEPDDMSPSATPRKRINPITVTLVAAIVFAAGYSAFERIGTTANAKTVEYTQNLAGGFLAVGLTPDQPGFVALSALDQDQVDVSAALSKNRIAGTHTVVHVQTKYGVTQVRLRRPQVILITEQNAVEHYEVDWSLDDFNILREAADCSRAAAIKKHRCGTPFTDLREVFATWPKDHVPERVRAFLVSQQNR